MKIRDIIQILETAMVNWKLTPIDHLSKETQADICGWIADNIPLFDNDEQYVKDNLLNLAKPPMLWVGALSVKLLHSTMQRKPSEIAVKKYSDMLLSNSNFQFDPILVSNGKFLDGGHRLEAYYDAGRPTIPVVEIGYLINTPPDIWQAWIDGENIELNPGNHS